MKAYWTVFSARFRLLLQYRAAALAGIATQIFWGLIRVMIFWGFYSAADGPMPMSYDEVVTYVWLGQALLLLVMFYVEQDLAAMIRDGTIAYEMVRPVNLFWFWYSRAIAGRVAPVTLRVGPVLILALLFFDMQLPASSTYAALFLISVCLSALLAASIALAMTVSLFWTLSGDGINRIVVSASFVFSGIVIPVPLFPDWLRPLVEILPFRGLADTPYRLYLGHISMGEAGTAIAHQVIWIGGMLLFGYAMLRSGSRRLVVQGG